MNACRHRRCRRRRCRRPTHCLPLILSIFALAACGALWPFLTLALLCSHFTHTAYSLSVCICCALSHTHSEGEAEKKSTTTAAKMILTKARALVFYAKLRYFCVGGHCCCCFCSCSISMYVCMCHVHTANMCVCTYSGRPFAHNVLFGFCTCILCALAAALLFMAFNPIAPPTHCYSSKLLSHVTVCVCVRGREHVQVFVCDVL